MDKFPLSAFRRLGEAACARRHIDSFRTAASASASCNIKAAADYESIVDNAVDVIKSMKIMIWNVVNFSSLLSGCNILALMAGS